MNKKLVLAIMLFVGFSRTIYPSEWAKKIIVENRTDSAYSTYTNNDMNLIN